MSCGAHGGDIVLAGTKLRHRTALMAPWLEGRPLEVLEDPKRGISVVSTESQSQHRLVSVLGAV